jgi:hypothetical protein
VNTSESLPESVVSVVTLNPTFRRSSKARHELPAMPSQCRHYVDQNTLRSAKLDIPVGSLTLLSLPYQGPSTCPSSGLPKLHLRLHVPWLYASSRHGKRSLQTFRYPWATLVG